MSSGTFLRLGYRHLFRHPIQSFLMILGITLGVAVAVAIDLANASASRAFDLSVNAVSGNATHQISGGPTGFDENLYTLIKNEGLNVKIAPVIREYVTLPQLDGKPLQLLGIDLFAEPPFRNYLSEIEVAAQPSSTAVGEPDQIDLVTFLTRPGAVLLSGNLMERYNLGVGDSLILEIAGRPTTGVISGRLDPQDPLNRRAVAGLVLADIATAQELTGRLGRIDQIELILPSNTQEASSLTVQIGEMLPEEVNIFPIEARSGVIAEMTSAFRVNLAALSLLALVVGLFLIYNTMTFSIVQRRRYLGILRSLGVQRGELFRMVIGEALLVGLVGSSLGIILGVGLGQGVIRLVSRTINDLFFVVTVQDIGFPLISLIKGLVLGTFATVLAALPPAYEAASDSPQVVMTRSQLEGKAGRAVWAAAMVGLMICLIGGVILLLPIRNLVLSFIGTFFVIAGFAMLAPIFAVSIARIVSLVSGRVWGTPGRMAPRSVLRSLSRTSVAVSALMVAVSVSIGVSLMVGSFRYTVTVWLDQVLNGDIYITAPMLTATASSNPIDIQVIQSIETWEGIRKFHMLRSIVVESSSGPIHIAATNNPDVSNERLYLAKDGTFEQIQQRIKQGAVLVSEPLARRLNLPFQNGNLDLYTELGEREFPVSGVFYDYATTQGTVLMTLDTYRRYWKDEAITSIALYLEPGVDPEETVLQLERYLPGTQSLIIRPNQKVKEEVLEIFDQTFAITGALQLLAMLVAFIGILSALLSLELERQREFGILRAIGLTTRQLWGLVVLETGILGSASGMLAMPTGYTLALILVYIINRRSFGWTLQLQGDFTPFLQAFLLAVIASVLAGIYPALRASRMIAAEAVRYE